MIFQTEEEQQVSASSKTFPASWTESGIGKAGIVLMGIAFMIAFLTQMINAIKAPFIKDLKTSEPDARRWEAFLVHTMGRIGFFGRAVLFGTLSGFFWDSLAQRNESGEKNMVAAAVSKLANTAGGRFLMVVLGVCLVIYACFAVSNAYYKYFPTPPPTRQEFYTNAFVHPEITQPSPTRPAVEEKSDTSFFARFFCRKQTDDIQTGSSSPFSRFFHGKSSESKSTRFHWRQWKQANRT